MPIRKSLPSRYGILSHGKRALPRLIFTHHHQHLPPPRIENQQFASIAAFANRDPVPQGKALFFKTPYKISPGHRQGHRHCPRLSPCLSRHIFLLHHRHVRKFQPHRTSLPGNDFPPVQRSRSKRPQQQQGYTESIHSNLQRQEIARNTSAWQTSVHYRHHLRQNPDTTGSSPRRSS